MFQSFKQQSDPSQVAPRIARLRAEMKARGVNGYLIPRADEHQGEDVAPHAQRLAWATGFTGSAGLALVLETRAVIFIDGRYTLQVRDQIDLAVIEPVSTVEIQPDAWISANIEKGIRIAYDPWLLTVRDVEGFEKAAQSAGAELVAIDGNLVDAVWEDQPEPPLGVVRPYPLEFAGRRGEEKLDELAGALTDARTDAAVHTLPDVIAWLLNIRGRDINRTPVPHAFAISHSDGTLDLFIDERKLTDEVRAHLGNRVTVAAPDQLGTVLTKLGQEGKRVRLDDATAPVWVERQLIAAGAKIAIAQDPCLYPKSCKNEAELNGARSAHRRDGIPVTRFLAWLNREAPSGTLDEIKAAQQLEAFRTETGELEDISFDSISAAGGHAAIAHYRVNEATNAPIKPGEIYLIDSGAQYLEGTTDITRTIIVGEPTQEMRERFTRVLQGHIALSCARFPKGTNGVQLDVLARMALWYAGLDYDHGTGHGVGAYLGVHEGPISISKAPRAADLRPGMIISNEPGYYKPGAYGIRIENLVAVTPLQIIEGGDREMMGFETLTLAPIDRNLIAADLLQPFERDWLNAYHDRVREEIGPSLKEVDGQAYDWLQGATRPI